MSVIVIALLLLLDGNSSHYTLDLKEAQKHDGIFACPFTPLLTVNLLILAVLVRLKPALVPLKPIRVKSVINTSFIILVEQFQFSTLCQKLGRKEWQLSGFRCTGVYPLTLLLFLISFLAYQLKSLVRNQEMLLLQTQSTLVRHAQQKFAQYFLMRNFNYFKGTLKMVTTSLLMKVCSFATTISSRFSIVSCRVIFYSFFT